MKRLNIEIHEELMKNIKIQAAKEGVSIRLFITRCILAGLHKKHENKKTT